MNHELIDQTVTGRALEALDALTEEAGILCEKIRNDGGILATILGSWPT
jgi:hypothetical protein